MHVVYVRDTDRENADASKHHQKLINCKEAFVVHATGATTSFEKNRFLYVFFQYWNLFPAEDFSTTYINLQARFN